MAGRYVGCGEVRTASVFESMQTRLQFFVASDIFDLENTLQAYPAVRRRDAQTGGFIFVMALVSHLGESRV